MNPYSPCGEGDFKSPVSTIPPLRPTLRRTRGRRGVNTMVMLPVPYGAVKQRRFAATVMRLPYSGRGFMYEQAKERRHSASHRIG